MREEVSTVANEVEVTIYWPEGGSTVWRTGHPILDADGVGPLTGKVLGAVTGMLTGAGRLAPLDDDRQHFAALVGREELAAELARILPDLDRHARGDAGGAV